MKRAPVTAVLTERARTIFVHRPDHPRHGRSQKHQRRFLASVLGVVGASRFDRIGGFDCLHGLSKRVSCFDQTARRHVTRLDAVAKP
jgi:hypothetical protein